MATRKPTRIQTKNRAIIGRAALEIFSRDGFRGATVDAIAEVAGMSKPNLLYYFPTKDDIYRSLMEGLLEDWLTPLIELDPDGEPTEQISDYIKRKIELARDFPMESRLFANEMIRGAPILKDVLTGDLRALVDEKAALIRQWMDEGRLQRTDPYHLIFAIWATTQHYADFDVQVRALLGNESDRRFEDAATTLQTIFFGWFEAALTSKHWSAKRAQNRQGEKHRYGFRNHLQRRRPPGACASAGASGGECRFHLLLVL